MREIATTLTDYLLALVSFAAALKLLARLDIRGLIGPVLFFLGFACATLIGGTWHGFFSAPNAPFADVIWWLSMLSAGISSAGLAVTGVELLGYRHRAPLLTGTLLFAAAFGAYVWLNPGFLSSLTISVIGSVLCIAGLARQLRLGKTMAASLALAAIGLSILAALGQQAGIAIHPMHFDHNATYHLVLLPALGLFYAGMQRITT